MKTIFKSKSINNLFKDIYRPKEFNQQIIAILLMLNHKLNPSRHINNIDTTFIDKKLIQEIDFNCSTKRDYIKGLIRDLQTWKQYIFIEQNVEDIHYLDASFFDNCLEIENFILSNPQENDEDFDDLEFF